MNSLLLPILIVVVLFFCWRSYRRAKPRNPTGKRKKSIYHAVEAHLHAGCCARVKRIKGKRFLATEAPVFPLAGCTSPHCRCDYIHHDDRRQEGRRSSIGLAHDLYGKNGEPERRSGRRRGRRSTD